MLPNLAVLQKKCADLGLSVVQKGKRPGKAEHVEALREHFIKRDYPQGMPFEEITPMLCFASWNLKPEELEAIWESDRWIADPKENGCRLMLHFTAQGVFCHSRTESLKTYRYQELTGKLLFASFVDSRLVGTSLDVEVIVEKSIDTRKYTAKGEITKTSLHSTTSLLHLADESSKACQIEQDAPLTFKVLDVVKFGENDLRKATLELRLQIVSAFFEIVGSTEIGKYFIRLPQARGGAKKAFLQEIWAKGGEGVVLKNLDSTYEDSSSRNRAGWVKVKKRLEFDAFVSGFKPGEADAGWSELVGALEFSVNLAEGGTHVIGYCSNIPLETRKEITRVDGNGAVKLIPELYGRVAEISGQDISAREFRLSHCTLDRWRTAEGDVKTADQCVVSLADLKQAAEWVG